MLSLHREKQRNNPRLLASVATAQSDGANSPGNAARHTVTSPTAAKFKKKVNLMLNPKEVEVMPLTKAQTNPLFAIMRILLKIFLLPVRLAISIFAAALGFVLGSRIVNIAFQLISGLLFLGFLGMAWSAIFVQTDMPLLPKILMPSLALLASYITSPTYGVLSFTEPIIEKLEGFNEFLKLN